MENYLYIIIVLLTAYLCLGLIGASELKKTGKLLIKEYIRGNEKTYWVVRRQWWYPFYLHKESEFGTLRGAIEYRKRRIKVMKDYKERKSRVLTDEEIMVEEI